MPPQEAPADEKVYRFISDPRHKENLSGRVRAACVTCRRKKIKCSGEVPCSTCVEKGIACEGLTERKRPKKNPEGLKIQDLPTRKGSATSPAESLHTVSSIDSGYWSARQQPQEESSCKNAQRAETVVSMNSTLARYDSSAEISPIATESQDWSYVRQHRTTGYPPTETAGSEISQSTQVPSTATSTKSMDWPDPSDRSTWWHNNHDNSDTATNLLSAARALEEQALSLRRLASEQDADFVDTARRQTVALPLQTDSAGSDYRPLFSVGPMGTFDDMALLLNNRASGSGITPTPAEFASFWDVNPHLSPTLGYDQASTSVHASALPGSQTLEPADPGWNFARNQGDQSAPIQAMPTGHHSDEAPSHKTKTTQADNQYQSGNAYGQYYHWPE